MNRRNDSIHIAVRIHALKYRIERINQMMLASLTLEEKMPSKFLFCKVVDVAIAYLMLKESWNTSLMRLGC